MDVSEPKIDVSPEIGVFGDAPGGAGVTPARARVVRAGDTPARAPEAERCAAPGCGDPGQGPAPICLAHWFEVPADVRHAFFEALDAVDTTPGSRRRLDEARQAIVASLAGSSLPATPQRAPTGK